LLLKRSQQVAVSESRSYLRWQTRPVCQPPRFPTAFILLGISINLHRFEYGLSGASHLFKTILVV